jgi:hypothetical protein
MALKLDVLPRVLLWPIISLLVTGSWHFVVEAVWPDLRNYFVPAVLALVLIAYGAWAGYRSITAGGSYVTAIVAGLILGLLPLALDIVGFGLILGRGFDAGLLAGVFGLSVVVFGALLGGGFETAQRQR